MQAIIFIAELTNDIMIDCNIYYPNYDENLIYKAIHYISRFTNDLNQDITPAVRCVEIILNHDKSNSTCKHFIDVAYTCKFADKIGGPKNAINRLWSSS